MTDIYYKLKGRFIGLVKKLLVRGTIFISHFYKLNSENHLDNLEMRTVNQLLENYSPCPKGTARCENKIAETRPYDLQIVVPVYKVEKYLCECVDSIIRQKTKYNVLIILVDDGSPDSCPKICDEYAEMDERIKVIHKPNGGLSSARNEGIKEILAKYIMFVDSDDRLIDGSIDKLMDTAYIHNADIVQGSYQGLKDGISTKKVGYSRTGLIEYSKLLGFAWGKVFRSELFSGICFPEGYWFEDTIGSFLVFPKSKCCWGLSDVIYEYRENSQGISNQANSSHKVLDTFWVTKLLAQERRDNGYDNDIIFFRILIGQFIMNQKRLYAASESVRKAVFNLSSSIYLGFFPHPVTLGTEIDLFFENAFRYNNYNLFSRIVKWL